MTIPRYSAGAIADYYEYGVGEVLKPSKNGDFVLHSDYATAEARVRVLEEALRNYADRNAWNWEGDGYSWNGSTLDYRVPPYEIAEKALEEGRQP